MCDGKWILKGIVSWGIGCVRFGVYGVYLNVKDFLLWICNIVKSEMMEINLSWIDDNEGLYLNFRIVEENNKRYLKKELIFCGNNYVLWVLEKLFDFIKIIL